MYHVCKQAIYNVAFSNGWLNGRLSSSDRSWWSPSLAIKQVCVLNARFSTRKRHGMETWGDLSPQNVVLDHMFSGSLAKREKSCINNYRGLVGWPPTKDSGDVMFH